jgi:hypothetical protein
MQGPRYFVSIEVFLVSTDLSNIHETAMAAALLMQDVARICDFFGLPHQWRDRDALRLLKIT